MSNSCNNSPFSPSCEIAVLSSLLADKVDKSTRDFPVVPEKFLKPWRDTVAQILDLLLLPYSPAPECCGGLCKTGSSLAVRFSVLGGVQQFPFVQGRSLCFVVGRLNWTSNQWRYTSEWGGCRPVRTDAHVTWLVRDEGCLYMQWKYAGAHDHQHHHCASFCPWKLWPQRTKFQGELLWSFLQPLGKILGMQSLSWS